MEGSVESWLQVKEPQTRIRDLSSGVEGNPALESPYIFPSVVDGSTPP